MKDKHHTLTMYVMSAWLIIIVCAIVCGVICCAGCAYMPVNLDVLVDRELDKLDKPDEPLPEDGGPEQPADLDEVSQGFTHPAVVTHTIKYVRNDAGNVYFEGAKRDWPMGEGDCNGECHLFVRRGGKWVGSKFDHVRPNTGSRDFKNIHGGYGVWATLGEPAQGEVVAFMLISYKKDKRTNAIFFSWK